MDKIYDVVIIGGGPGGYTAALYCARAGLSTMVLEKLSAGGQMALTSQIDNYPGFEEGIDGFSLAEKMLSLIHICVILAVVLVAITAGTIFFGYSKASGKITKSGAEEEQRYAWPLATCSTEDTITHIFATQFAKEVEKLSDGKMKINVYPQSTLGGDRELMESCKDGDIPFVVQSPAPQVSFMPQLCVCLLYTSRCV